MMPPINSSRSNTRTATRNGFSRRFFFFFGGCFSTAGFFLVRPSVLFLNIPYRPPLFVLFSACSRPVPTDPDPSGGIGGFRRPFLRDTASARAGPFSIAFTASGLSKENPAEYIVLIIANRRRKEKGNPPNSGRIRTKLRTN